MLLFSISIGFFLIYSLYKSKKAMHMLQQNYYDESNRYLFWMFKNLKKVFGNIDILLILASIMLMFVNINNDIKVILYSLLAFIVFVLYYKKEKKEQVKKPLVITARIKRLLVTQIIIYFIPIILFLINYDSEKIGLYYLILSSMVYLSYFIVLFGNYINKNTVEKLVYLSFKTKAMKKLKSMNLPVIGITGSYGKTSSKNIINDILSVKFNSFATPKNFNTPYGMIRSINNHLDKFNDLFIAEMGAFKIGEINSICKMMKPTHGVLTTIGEAHLESFGSRENIQKGKFELIESLPSGGIAILNGDDEWQVNYKLKNSKCRVLWTGIDNQDADIVALNIKLSGNGTNFDVKFKGDDNLYNFNTRLLGKHNVYNLLAGILLGKELGMNINELKRGVSSVKTIEHRLELKKSGTLNIIDDAYNSNPVGSKMALDVLKLMPGTKIVVTPGMIELGDKQYELNKKFGEYIADSSDYVILVGKEQTKPIYDGLLECNYNKDKIYVINDVVDAFSIMNRINDGNTYVLLENDLPDLFNE